MKRGLLFALLCSCSSPMSPQDSGVPDAGTDSFNVFGTALMYPEGAALLSDAGQSTSVAGLFVRVEEPFKIALNDSDPLGIFSTAYLDAGGEFSAMDVQIDSVTLGVAGGIRDNTDAGRVIRAATPIWDVALQGGKPEQDITGAKSYAVPTLYHDALTQAVGAAQIQGVTHDAGTLIRAGFILGRIVDASGTPVSGATLTPEGGPPGQFFYPKADLSGTGSATSTTGQFIYVHNGGDVQTFSVTVTGQSQYKRRTAGATHDACLVLTIYPGDNPP
jgi:hypothetical protein